MTNRTKWNVLWTVVVVALFVFTLVGPRSCTHNKLRDAIEGVQHVNEAAQERQRVIDDINQPGRP